MAADTVRRTGFDPPYTTEQIVAAGSYFVVTAVS